MLNIFEVGGCVRDEILGVSTNDIDFTFVRRLGTNVISPKRSWV
jgi:tRNA nucleotidyltransferase/poly(A) polymerase